MHVTESDKIWLKEFRDKIDACPLCKGTDTNCSCYRNFYIEVKKVEEPIKLNATKPPKKLKDK